MLSQNSIDKIYEINRDQNSFIDSYTRYEKKTYNRGKRSWVKIKKRPINAPIEVYKEILNEILHHLEGVFPIHNSSYAWLKGRSREMCASRHIGKKWVMELDIEDFFGNITYNHLFYLFAKYNTISILGINTNTLVEFVTLLNKDGKRVLAQGFPTSPLFANAVRYPIDCKIQEIADNAELTFTNYGDNFFLSGENPKNYENQIINLVDEYGFSINPSKTKLMYYGSRQQILGITVNKKVQIPKPYVESVVSEIMECVKNKRILSDDIKGKLNVLSIAENKRVYRYLKNLIKRSNLDVKSEV